MNTNHSSATPTHEYQPTIIETKLLIRRLAIQIEFLKHELTRSWVEFKSDPVVFTRHSIHHLFSLLRRFLSTPNVMYGCATAMMAVTAVVIIAFVVQSTSLRPGVTQENPNEAPVELIALVSPPDSPRGPEGNGLSGSRNPGGGGDRNPLPPSFGKPPAPSIIPAPIPTTPPVHPLALPVAGINIDPSQWIDVEARVYGDPNSKSETPSNGSGEGGGIGTGKGTGIGIGEGFGRGGPCGPVRNIGGREVPSCAGEQKGSGAFKGSEVDQKARLLFKPEPQYTEEARQNQITGTVMLRAVFSSAGEVDQIRAMRTLPFGLTERAIAAARQIKFVPAMKDGHPVSVQMQLEYNFHLY